MLAISAIKGAGWLVLSRFVGRGIDFVTLLILARILSPADFGMTALAMSLIVIVDTVLELPVTQALMRMQAVDRSHLDTGFTLGVLRSCMVALVILGSAWPFAHVYDDPRLLPLLAVLAIGPVSKGFYNPNMSIFGREMNFKQTFIAELAAKFIAFLAAVATVVLGGGYWAIVANFVVSGTSNTIASYVLAPYRPSFTLVRFSEFSGFIGWFSSSQIVSALNWQFDRILLGKFLDRASLGRYALANDLSVFPTQSLIGPAMQPLMVAFSKINEDRARLRTAFLRTARFAMLLSAPICLGLSLTADLSVSFLLGPKWEDAAPLLKILAPTVLAVPYFQALYAYCLAVNRPVILFRLNLIDLGLRVALVSFGLYLYALDGVTVGRAIAAAIMFGFYLAYVKWVVGPSVSAQLKNLWKVGAAAIVMTVSVATFRHTLEPTAMGNTYELAACIAVGASSYLATLYAVGLRLIVTTGRFELWDRWW